MARKLYQERRVCDWCKGHYTPRGWNQRFCSPDCADAYYVNEQKTRGRFLIFRRDGFRCIYCGRTSLCENGEVALHADHVVPQREGGATVAANLVTSCSRCNVEKNSEGLPGYIEKKLLLLVAHRNEVQDITGNLTIKL